MSVVNLLQHQLEKEADVACHRRNQNLPFEVGTASYDVIEQGVLLIQHHYKMDSAQSDYSEVVAKIIYTEAPLCWSLWLRQHQQGVESWVPYSHVGSNATLKELMDIVVMDPHQLIWCQP